MTRCPHTVDWTRGYCDRRWRDSPEYRRRIEEAVRAAMSKSGAYGGNR